MSGLSTYQAATDFAEGWGLCAMFAVFLAFVIWPFRRGARRHHDDAANIIFKDDSDGE